MDVFECTFASSQSFMEYVLGTIMPSHEWLDAASLIQLSGVNVALNALLGPRARALARVARFYVALDRVPWAYDARLLSNHMQPLPQSAMEWALYYAVAMERTPMICGRIVDGYVSWLATRDLDTNLIVRLPYENGHVSLEDVEIRHVDDLDEKTVHIKTALWNAPPPLHRATLIQPSTLPVQADQLDAARAFCHAHARERAVETVQHQLHALYRLLQ
jgi:hypothetical protein